MKIKQLTFEIHSARDVKLWCHADITSSDYIFNDNVILCWKVEIEPSFFLDADFN